MVFDENMLFQVLPNDMLDFLDAPVPYVVSIQFFALTDKNIILLKQGHEVAFAFELFSSLKYRLSACPCTCQFITWILILDILL